MLGRKAQQVEVIEQTPEEMDALMVEFDRASEKAGPHAFEEAHKIVVDMGSTLVHM